MARTFEKGILLNFKELIDYSDGGVVSKQVLKNEAGNITLFSFDKEEGLTPHTSPYDAVLQVLEGETEIIIGEEKFNLKEGETIILPANIQHGVHATERFKMLLTMIKGN